MELSAISYTPEALVSFTLEDLDLIIKCSKGHYDGVCQDASRESDDFRKCGFLITMRRVLKMFIEDGHTQHQEYLSFGKLDTIAKILESSSFLRDDSEREKGLSLHWDVHKVLQTINANRIEPKPVTL